MDKELKKNIKMRSTWMRAFYMLFFAVCYGLAETLVTAIAIFQFLFVLFTFNTNKRLLKFGQGLGTYIYQILQFLTFNDDYHPYPLGAWPVGEPKAVVQHKNISSSEPDES